MRLDSEKLNRLRQCAKFRSVVGWENLRDLIDEIDRLKSAIAKVLADEESGKGWGPDVTTVRFLKSALEGE